MCERQMTIKLGLGPDQVFNSRHKSVGVPVYSARTLSNPRKHKRLKAYYGRSSYQILTKDYDKVMKKIV